MERSRARDCRRTDRVCEVLMITETRSDLPKSRLFFGQPSVRDACRRTPSASLPEYRSTQAADNFAITKSLRSKNAVAGGCAFRNETSKWQCVSTEECVNT